ncbi:MAG: hypothetical protein IT580_09875 [Verrucomicrobiales bacterium]|nr:hypothetical protein [Verrucomicrobiales bacterium]
MEARGASSPTLPAAVRRAVLDVGTNSVKLLVAAVQAGSVIPLLEQSRQTRLGEGFFESRQLSPLAIERTVAAIQELLSLSAAYAPASLRLVATAAAREALNADHLQHAVQAATGRRLEVIDGDTEADWSFRGVGTGPEGHHGLTLVTDLGGGSTEFILGYDGVRSFARSFPLGANRLLSQLRDLADPPGPHALARCRGEIDAFLQTHLLPSLLPSLQQYPASRPNYRAVGGSAVILARMMLEMSGFHRETIESRIITRAELESLVVRLWALDLDARRRLVGLPPERADIILTGAAIHEGILRNLNLDAFRASTRGLRFAALLHPPPPLP